MKQDIETRQDIEMLMRAFYQKVLTNATIGFFFTKIVQLDLQKHLPVITDFWESILLNRPEVYKGNAMAAHVHLHAKHPIEPQHLQEWLRVFEETVHENFEGNRAELARQRAKSIATIMQIKFNPNPQKT